MVVVILNARGKKVNPQIRGYAISIRSAFPSFETVTTIWGALLLGLPSGAAKTLLLLGW